MNTEYVKYIDVGDIFIIDESRMIKNFLSIPSLLINFLSMHIFEEVKMEILDKKNDKISLKIESYSEDNILIKFKRVFGGRGDIPSYSVSNVSITVDEENVSSFLYYYNNKFRRKCKLKNLMFK